MTFRYATIGDLPEIVAIYNATIPSRLVTADLSPVTVADKTDWYHHHNKENRPLWVCISDDNEIIGWVSLQDFYGRPAYNGCVEISIYLKETHRGKGLGKAALKYALDSCSSLNIHTVLGFIFEQNTTSIQLFSSFGFEVWGKLPEIANMEDYYCSLLIMGKKI